MLNSTASAGSSCELQLHLRRRGGAAAHARQPRAGRRRRQCPCSSNIERAAPTRRVQVDVGDAFEEIEVPLRAPGSRVLTPTVQLPMGLTFEGELLVVDVARGSNAERAGVRKGDLLRGTTAVRLQMEYPTANLMFGGVGRPKLKKLLFPTATPTGPRPLALCMGAVRSNEQLDSSACLVLERPSPPPQAEVPPAAGGPFDARLFE